MEDNNKDMDLNPADDAQPEIAETQEDAAETAKLNEVRAESVEEAKAADAAEPELKTTSAVASSTGGSGLGSGTKALIVVLLIALLGGGLLFWKSKNAPHDNAPMSKLTKEDMEFLLKDASPMMLKRLEDPEVKKAYLGG